MRSLFAISVVLALAGCVSPAAGTRTIDAPTRAAVDAAMKNVPVVVYMTSWCPACARARIWLQERGYSYRPLDVEQDLRAALRLRRLSPSGNVPTFDVGGTIVVGFDPPELHDAIARAAGVR